jgi:hypothetical protein
VVELLTGSPLFEATSGKDWDVFEDHLARITETLEENFSLGMLSKSQNRSKYFREDGGCLAHFHSLLRFTGVDDYRPVCPLYNSH